MADKNDRSGDEVVIKLLVRKANLPKLLEGVCLGLDAETGNPIGMRLEREPGRKREIYRLAVVSPKSAAVAAVPQPVFADPRLRPN